MENNKILIGIKFVSGHKCVDYELYVIKDVKFKQLLDGINYGLEKLKAQEDEYNMCRAVFDSCTLKENEPYAKKGDNITYYRSLSLESYVRKDSANISIEQNRFRFMIEDGKKTLEELGFISSSILVFDCEGTWKSKKQELNANEVAEAFKREDGKKKRIEFPEYNISTRQLVTYDTTPVDIIPPGEPPQKNRVGVLSAILPSLISMIMLLSYRVFAGGGTGNIVIIVLSVVTGALGVFSTLRSFSRQKKDYNQSLVNWREQYAVYIEGKINEIKKRQVDYKNILEKRYPTFSSLGMVGGKEKSIPIINSSVYSRHPQDSDFLSVRLGTSTAVETPFAVNGEMGDTVYSNAYFAWKKEKKDGRDAITGVRLFLREEVNKKQEVFNLCELPGKVSEAYQCIGVATPYLYSMRCKGALGILDNEVGYLNAKNLVDSILLDLCYYHSPENLQIVMVFNEEKNNSVIEDKINKYKFMPHFRGLIDGVSQFVFDRESANLVYGNMCKLMNERRTENNSEDNEGLNQKVPHVVFVVLEGEDYGLKEHAFAEFLPKPPIEGNEFVNPLGLTFLYVSNYREYLPAYCNDILSVDKDTISILPQNGTISNYDVNSEFTEMIARTEIKRDFLQKDVMNGLFDQLSTIYYARIAENGKVPSVVSMFDLWSEIKEAAK